MIWTWRRGGREIYFFIASSGAAASLATRCDFLAAVNLLTVGFMAVGVVSAIVFGCICRNADWSADVKKEMEVVWRSLVLGPGLKR